MLDKIKKNKFLLISLCVLTVIISAGTSYAFFYVGDSGKDKTINFANLSVNYTDGQTINLVNSLPMEETEVDKYATKKSFSVTNTSNRTAYLKIALTSMTLPTALNDENFKWTLYEGDSRIKDGTFYNAGTELTLFEGVSINSNETKDYSIAFWILDNHSNQNSMLNATFKSKITVSVSDKTQITTMNYTGNVQKFMVPKTGTYKIEATGASGTVGNTYSYNGSKEPNGGKGAYISSEFELEAGDELTIIVGGIGNVTKASTKDGTSGAGGGGSFVFKTIDNITNSSYQFEKNGINYDTLVVAAGGGGSNDTSNVGIVSDGLDGIGSTWYSTSNTGSYSTISTVSTSNSVLGIGQFISNDLKGGAFTRSGVCTGGFGGGSCGEDDVTPGGGWNGTTQATSFSSGTNTIGSTGSNVGMGSVIITYISNNE